MKDAAWWAKYRQLHREKIRETARKSARKSTRRRFNARQRLARALGLDFSAGRIVWRQRSEPCSPGFWTTPRNRRYIGHQARYSKYRLRPNAYKALLIESLGLCAICSSPSKGLCIDHDHSKAKGKGIRGLLCPPCNSKLAWFERFSEVIHAYLQRGSKCD